MLLLWRACELVLLPFCYHKLNELRRNLSRIYTLADESVI